MYSSKPILILLSSLALAGCATTDKEPHDEPLSQTQIDMTLSKARPPQQFGFAIRSQNGGIAYVGQGRLHPNHFTVAKMIEDDLPVISMRGRSKRNNMNVLVDIGSSVSWMEFSTAQDFDAHFMGIDDLLIPYRGKYNTGGIKAFAAVVTQVRIDNLFIENVPFYVRMSQGSLGPLARGIRKPKIDAVIGYDNLQGFEYIQFDLQNNTIAFSATRPYEPNPDLLVDSARITRVPGHGLAVEGVVDDEFGPVILDFGGNYHFARGDVKVATTRNLELGHLAFDDVQTLLLPVHAAPPRVGRKLLAPYLITICNRKGVVHFEQFPRKD